MKVIMLSAMYENGGNTTHRMLDGHPGLFVYPFESQVGTGAAQAMTSNSGVSQSFYDGYVVCNPPAQVYIGAWSRSAANAATLTVTTTNSASASPVLSGAMGSGGAYAFGVGGSTPINATTLNGSYSGNFTVTVAYN